MRSGLDSRDIVIGQHECTAKFSFASRCRVEYTTPVILKNETIRLGKRLVKVMRMILNWSPPTDTAKLDHERGDISDIISMHPVLSPRLWPVHSL